MRTALIFTVLGAAAALGADGERLLNLTPHRGLPPAESVIVYHSRDGKREKLSEGRAEKPLALPAGGPFEVWVKPKGGVAVKVLDKLTVNSGQTHELKLGDLVGAVEVFGDNFPRADRIVLTDPRDPGPGEKGHAAIQTASDYRREMAVPPGMYAVWVVPANGAKPQRVVDNVRVQAGRTVRVGG